MSELKAAILGATGQTGGRLLSALLSLPAYSQVYEFGRRIADLSDQNASAGRKRTAKAIDLDQLTSTPEIGQCKADVVFITLGTTRKNAGSAEAFVKIDQNYVVDFAQAARDNSNARQRVVYQSSAGASASSPLLYTKSKGQTEKRLSELGYAETIVFRPGLLTGTKRPESRIAEVIYGKITGFGSLFSSSLEIDISLLGKAMAQAGVLGIEGLGKANIGSEQSTGGPGKAWIITNSDALRLAKLAA